MTGADAGECIKGSVSNKMCPSQSDRRLCKQPAPAASDSSMVYSTILECTGPVHMLEFPHPGGYRVLELTYLCG